MDWRENLSKLLISRGIEKQSLCRELGLNDGYLTAILRPGSNPTMENLNKICSALDITIGDLYSERPLVRTEDIEGLIPYLSKLERKNLRLLLDRVETSNTE